jgi:plastocyanin
MSAARVSFVLVSVLAACGGDDGGTKPIDAPVTPSVVEVNPCPATPDATFMTMAASFNPSTAMINQGQVAKFISTSTHPIAALAGTDPALNVAEGATKCFRFTMAGMFKFKCTVHGYVGTLTVQ